ncbi:MAG: YceI family protein [Thermoanaerobaculia bacterium]
MNTELSRLLIEGRSSIHPIEGEAKGLSGEADVAMTDGRLDLEPPPVGHLEFPVEGLRSGNMLQDFETMRRLEAKKSPIVSADLRRVILEPGSPDRYRIDADLTFHGLTRRIAVDATAQLGESQAVLESEFTFDVTAFDVKPPSFLGLSVRPEVKVRVRLVLDAV